MTRKEFCEKWKNGWRKMYHDGSQAYFFTQEQMKNDLDEVIHTAVLGWKKFVDAEVQRTVDLDEWQRQEAEAIQKKQ